MALQTCWRCLARSLCDGATVAKPMLSAFPFSTSAPTAATAPAKPKPGSKRVTGRGIKMNYQVQKKTFQRDDRSKKPAPGERKAMRKRIVLSNPNALEVKAMKEFDKQALSQLRDLNGQVLAFQGETVDQLRAAEAFKSTQNWALFRKAGTLVRKETLEIAQLIEGIENEKRAERRVVTGERTSGKSLLALQAMTIGFLKGWTVINIPEAQDLIMGSTAYSPLPDSQLYLQKSYLASLLSKIAKSNTHLANVTLSSQPAKDAFPIPLQANISLARLAELGGTDPEIAHQVFILLVKELSLPGQGRPPMLICLDGLGHAFSPQTRYHDRDYKPIHALDLWILDWFMKYLNGSSSLPNGGLVLATNSGSNAPQNRTVEYALSQLKLSPSRSLQAPSSPIAIDRTHTSLPDAIRHNPFFPYDTRALSIFQSPGLQLQEVRGLSKGEAASLMEYWAKSGILRERVDEKLVGEKWTMSGGGVVGELERCCLRMRV